MRSRPCFLQLAVLTSAAWALSLRNKAASDVMKRHLASQTVLPIKGGHPMKQHLARHLEKQQKSAMTLQRTARVLSATSDPVDEYPLGAGETIDVFVTYGYSPVTWTLATSKSHVKYVLMTWDQVEDTGVPDATKWSSSSSEYIAAHSCTSSCTSVSHTAYDLDTSKTYVMWALNTGNTSASTSGSLTYTPTTTAHFWSFVSYDVLPVGESIVVGIAWRADSLYWDYITNSTEVTWQLINVGNDLNADEYISSASCTSSCGKTFEKTISNLDPDYFYQLKAMNRGDRAAEVKGIWRIEVTDFMSPVNNGYTREEELSVTRDSNDTSWPLFKLAYKDKVTFDLTSSSADVAFIFVTVPTSGYDLIYNASQDYPRYSDASCLTGCTNFKVTDYALDEEKGYSLMALYTGSSGQAKISGTYTARYKWLDTLSDSSSTKRKSNKCFSAHDMLQLRDGVSKPMSEIQVGDEILTVSSTGKLEYSPVVFLPHGANSELAIFVELLLQDGRTIRMTPDHLVASTADCKTLSPLATKLQVSEHLKVASSVNATDCVFITRAGGFFEVARVLHKSMVEHQGIHTAVTKNPYLVVNGVIASPFALNHAVPNAFYAILRGLYKVHSPALRSSWVQGAIAGVSSIVDVVIPAGRVAGLL